MKQKQGIWIAVASIVAAAGIAGYLFTDSEKPEEGRATDRAAGADVPTAPPVNAGDADIVPPPEKTAAGDYGEDRVASLEKIDFSKLPARIGLIAGLAEEKGYKARLDAVHDLPRDLPRGEAEALMAFLDTRFDNLSSQQANAVKNDVVEKLLRQETLPPKLGASLVEMYRDQENDPRWRDYCLQLASLCYTRERESGSPMQSAVGTEEMQEMFWNAIETEIDNGISSTALLSLKRLAEKHPEFERDRLRQATANVLANPDSHPRTRTTALQTAASLGDKQALPGARDAALNGETLPLRMAAVGAVGRLGGQSDIALLEDIAASAESAYLQNVAELALEKLKAKEGSE